MQSTMTEEDVLSLHLLSVLRKYFDRVICVIQEETGIVFTEKLSREMLVSFLRMRGHQYFGTCLRNLPWLFAYMTTAQSLFGERLLDGSPLMLSLKNRKEITFSEDNQIQSTTGKLLNLRFAFIGHEFELNGSQIQQETIEFVVSLNNKIVHTEKLVIKPAWFFNPASFLPERALRRNPTLLRVAEELLP